MDGALSIWALALAVAFIPLALGVAWRLLPKLRPPKHRPLLFVVGGLLMFSFGLLAAYTLRPAMASGTIHLSSRLLGELHASAAHQPLNYWLIALIIYGSGVLLAGMGLAGIGLCFRDRQGR